MTEETPPPVGAEARANAAARWARLPLALTMISLLVPMTRGLRGQLETPMGALWPLPLHAAALLMLLGISLAPRRAGRALALAAVGVGLLVSISAALAGTLALVRGNPPGFALFLSAMIAVLLVCRWALRRGKSLGGWRSYPYWLLALAVSSAPLTIAVAWPGGYHDSPHEALLGRLLVVTSQLALVGIGLAGASRRSTARRRAR